MKRLYIIAGPMSSGNRMLAALMVRAGCFGSGSTDQPKDEEYFTHDCSVAIEHAAGPGGLSRMDKLLSAASEKGYLPRIIWLNRDPAAQVKSMVSAGHAPDENQAWLGISHSHSTIGHLIRKFCCSFYMLSYEAIVARPHASLKALLEWCKLPTSTMNQPFVWQGRKTRAIYDANSRWMGDEPAQRIEHSKELTWWPERGMGFYPVPDLSKYDHDYFSKYQGYASTPMGAKLNVARMELVAKHAGFNNPNMVDVGIGSGSFLEGWNYHCEQHSRRPHLSRGYDVNPVGIGWLQQRELWLDPYKDPVDVATFWDSLEHIADPSRIVSRIGQWAFVSIPIFMDSDHVLRSKHFRKDEHFWYFTHDGLVRWFYGQGFNLVESNRMEEEVGREDIGTYVFRRR
jgi:hypothetical protein